MSKKIFLFLLFLVVHSIAYAAPSDEDFTGLAPSLRTDSFTQNGVAYTLISPSSGNAIVTFIDINNFVIAGANDGGTSDQILIFNFSSAGTINAPAGTADFRIATTDGSEFKIASMQADMTAQLVANGYIKTVTVSGFRDSVLITQDTVDFDSNDSSGSVTYTESAITAGSGGVLTFDTNWQNIDEIRFTTTDASKIAVLGIDALDFETAIPSAKAEPTNHPTNFTATTNSTTQITTAWTDATGAVAPDTYLVMCNKTGTFTDPVDTTAQTDDTNCQNGAGVQNIAHGTGTVAWTGLDAGTQYFYKIFPFTNTGSDVNYKTAGALTANATTTASINSDTTLTSASGITEPIDLPTTVSTTGDAVDLFDFTLTDGGGGDGLSTDVTQLIIRTSGTGDFSKVTWRLKGEGVDNVTGVYTANTITFTFSVLPLSVADGASETYILNGFFQDNSNITDNSTYLFSIDGANGSDVTVDSNKTQMSSG